MVKIDTARARVNDFLVAHSLRVMFIEEYDAVLATFDGGAKVQAITDVREITRNQGYKIGFDTPCEGNVVSRWLDAEDKNYYKKAEHVLSLREAKDLVEWMALNR